MHCPKCGCDLTLKDDFCPDCGENFEGMCDNEKKRVFNRPLKTNKVKINSVKDPGNLNGYVVEECRSIKGGKLRRGSSTSRGGSKPTGYDSNNSVRKAVHKLNALKDDDEENRPIKMDNVMKKALEKDVLGYDEKEL